jgi:hypothetical protein
LEELVFRVEITNALVGLCRDGFFFRHSDTVTCPSARRH